MKLRDHPLMSCLGMRNWPPAWLWNSGAEDTMPNGEVGLLKNVILSDIVLPPGVFWSSSIWGLNTSVVFHLTIRLSVVTFPESYATSAVGALMRLVI
jgi:hypothetical protein